jgi:histidinol-phosphate phosphatase family protein
MNLAERKPAVFLDRDGTLIEERCYVAHVSEVKLLPGAAAAVAHLRRAGFACVVATNQSGVGRGLFTVAQMNAVNEEVLGQLRAEGADIDGVYCCTAAPLGTDKTVVEYHDRKPGPGMLLRAASDLNLDLASSWVVGDSVSDVLAGRHAGCHGQILVRTGHDLAEALAFLGAEAVVARDLEEAADIILRSSPPGRGAAP